MESGPEIEFNDKQLEIRARAEYLGKLGSRLARCAPTLCYTLLNEGPDFDLADLFPSNNNNRDILDEELKAGFDLDDLLPDRCYLTSETVPGVDSCNFTEGLEFMSACGERMWNVTQQLLSYVILRAVPSIEDLTFNWNRCDTVVPRDIPVPLTLVSEDDGGNETVSNPGSDDPDSFWYILNGTVDVDNSGPPTRVSRRSCDDVGTGNYFAHRYTALLCLSSYHSKYKR